MLSDDDHVFPSLEIREQMHTLTVTQKLQVPKPKIVPLICMCYIFIAVSSEMLRLTALINR